MYDEDIIRAKEVKENNRALNAYNAAGKKIKDFIESSKILEKINSDLSINDNIDMHKWVTMGGKKVALWYLSYGQDDDRIDFNLSSDGRVFYEGLEIDLSLHDGEKGNLIILEELLEALKIFNNNYASKPELETKQGPEPKSFWRRFFRR
jgi:hypothetical protein